MFNVSIAIASCCAATVVCSERRVARISTPLTTRDAFDAVAITKLPLTSAVNVGAFDSPGTAARVTSNSVNNSIIR